MTTSSGVPSTEDADQWQDFNVDDNDLQDLLDGKLPQSSTAVSGLRTNEHHAGFDDNAGDTWIYPSNLPTRTYQLNIAQTALHRNTLVVLPTGLGKTFIAAVVMYNIYRWYPTSKVIFMAPTRPLVAQQITACQRVMPFPANDTVELTGKLQRSHRSDLWRTKRVFFATPQVVQSDMVAAECGEADFPFGQVKLLVFDEAHRARGRYAFTEVAQAVWRRHRYFRVLALSATPGRTVEDVAEVVRNLYISHLEVRFDSSLDVMAYVQQRSLKTVVVPMGDEIKAVREDLLHIANPYERYLIEAGVLGNGQRNLSRNVLLFDQKRFRMRSQQQRHPQQAEINSNFSMCISLHHALELLERHGMRVFLNYFEEDEEGRAKFVLNLDRRLRDLVDRLRLELGPNPFNVSANAMTNGKIAEMPQDLDFGHPKFEKARECLIEHFTEHPDSRAIVFCEYRESVMLIYRLLLQHSPLMRPRCFVGQGSSSGSLRSLTQRQQIQIMADFRSGKSNVLVATSIGEEGLDVGEVELIVCFDISTSNPTRFIQRIGRTGRKKSGRVVMFATEGREQQMLRDVLAHKDQINKKLLRSSVVQAALYKESPSLVPSEFNPRVMHTYIRSTAAEETAPAGPKIGAAGNPKTTATTKSRKEARAQAQHKEAPLPKGSQDLRNFFKKVPPPPPSNLDCEVPDLSDPRTSRHVNSTHRESQNNNGDKITEFFQDLNVSDIPSTSLAARAAIASRESNASPPKDSPIKHLPTDFVKFDPKRLRSLNKLLKSRSLMPRHMLECDFLAKLRLSKFSNRTKLALLKKKPALVYDVYEKMSVLRVVDLEEEHVAREDLERSMGADEQKIRQDFEFVETVFGGRAEIEAFLDSFRLKDLTAYQPCGSVKYRDEPNSMSDSEFDQAVEKVFEGCKARDFSLENYERVHERFKQTARYKQLMVHREGGSTFEEMPSVSADDFSLEEDLIDISDDFTMTESKYCSQWDQMTQRTTQLKSSTPMAKPVMDRASERAQGIIKSSALMAKLDEVDEEREIGGDGDAAIVPEQSSKHRPQNASSIGSVVDATVSLTDKADSLGKWGSDWSLDASVVAAVETHQRPNTPLDIRTELDNDLELFLEPFPEEEELLTAAAAESHAETTETAAAMPVAVVPPTPSPTSASSNSQKENLPIDEFVNFNTTAFVGTRNIFELDSQKMMPFDAPKDGRPITLSQRLEAKAMAAALSTTPPRKVCPNGRGRGLGLSPLQQVEASPRLEKSPSIFDRYKKRRQRRTSMARKNEAAMAPIPRAVPAEVDSPIVPRKSKTSKRKIFDSDSEGEQRLCEKADGERRTSKDKDSRTSSIRRQGMAKRRRVCAFVAAEAEVSGDNDSARSGDETELSADQYMLDSVVVSSGDDEEDNDAVVPMTQMQAVYLQSVRSPTSRRGAFKIPPSRVFNDCSQVFSQAMPIEASQYEADSFVVENEDVNQEPSAVDESICPLERAERILRQEQRARRELKKREKLYR